MDRAGEKSDEMVLREKIINNSNGTSNELSTEHDEEWLD